MPHCKLLFALLASLLLALPAFAQEGEEKAKPVDQKPAEIAQAAPKAVPAISWLDASGAPQKLEPARAKLTVLHFWATWCVPCLKELPELDKAAGDWHGKGLRVVALALDGANIQHIRDFYTAHHITRLTPNYDKDNEALRAMHGTALPLSILINSKGEEIARAEGPVDWSSENIKKFLEGALR